MLSSGPVSDGSDDPALGPGDRGSRRERFEVGDLIRQEIT